MKKVYFKTENKIQYEQLYFKCLENHIKRYWTSPFAAHNFGTYFFDKTKTLVTG